MNMTRRKFILSLLGAVGSVGAGFGTFDYVRNMRKIFDSKNFVDGKFRNENPVYEIRKGTLFDTQKRWLTKKNTVPEHKFHFNADAIPEQASADLKVMWTAHSSLFIEIGGKRFFCDPVWSKVLSPVGFGGPKRFFDPPLPVERIPVLDGVIISHDHMDHLDKKITKLLAQRGVPFYVPIGVDYVLKSWGIPEAQIITADWYSTFMAGDVKLTSVPCVHFSGRGIFDRNKALWTSWIIEGKGKKVFFGGDSGFHDGFKEFGEKYGPFDLTFLEIGAYDKNWDRIHLGPEAAVQAHLDLKGRVFMPIHWGAYDLSIHPWDEPVERVITAAEKNNVPLSLPRPGQLLAEKDFVVNSKWWEV